MADNFLYHTPNLCKHHWLFQVICFCVGQLFVFEVVQSLVLRLNLCQDPSQVISLVDDFPIMVHTQHEDSSLTTS